MFYDKLCSICHEKGISVTNMVKELGLSSGNLSKWKNGGAPRSDTLQKIANYLGVSTDTLLKEGYSQLGMSDIQYALYHETADVSEETLSKILEFARFAKEQEKKKR
ncbi:MAG: helix-turn-helix domain-containing protein [Candidatus Merdivicinus sp.]